jgi:hypothetical protein
MKPSIQQRNSSRQSNPVHHQAKPVEKFLSSSIEKVVQAEFENPSIRRKREEKSTFSARSFSLSQRKKRREVGVVADGEM